MELEEMKASWEALSKKVEKQDQLTLQIIENMTQQKFRSNLKKISYWEYAGTVVCLLGATYLALNIPKLHQLYVQVFAGISIALLVILPIISLRSIRGMRILDISSKSYSETLEAYARQKLRFQRIQQLNVLCTIALMAFTWPVCLDLMGKDLHSVPYFWSLMVPSGMLLFLVFAWWVLRYYNKTLDQAETIIAEIRR